MRVVFLISKLCAPAEFALNTFLKSNNNEDIEIVGIVASNITPFSKRYWKYAAYGIRRSGLFYGFLIALTSYLHLIGLLIATLIFWWRKRQWLLLSRLAARYNIPLHSTNNINSSESLEILKQWKPDVIVSLYFDQILKTEAISVSKIATINMHPGILPGYRGVWSNFWKLYKGEEQAGITIHHMNEKIDDGEILDQYSFSIKKGESRFALALKAASCGANRLKIVLNNFRAGIKMHPIPKNGKAKYRSLPTKRHFDKFYARGQRLINYFRDIKTLVKLSFNLNALDQPSNSSSSSSSSSKSSASESAGEGNS